MCCLTRRGRVLPAAIRVQALDVVQMSVVVRMVSMDVCFGLYFDQTRKNSWESSITANICKFKMHRTILLVVNSQEFVSILIISARDADSAFKEVVHGLHMDSFICTLYNLPQIHCTLPVSMTGLLLSSGFMQDVTSLVSGFPSYRCGG